MVFEIDKTNEGKESVNQMWQTNNIIGVLDLEVNKSIKKQENDLGWNRYNYRSWTHLPRDTEDRIDCNGRRLVMIPHFFLQLVNNYCQF